MRVQIAARTYDFTDPTGLLTDCQLRMEMFPGVL